MARNSDLLMTAIAPAIWGSTYLVTTEFLPDGYPLYVAMLRALPAGLLLLLLVRQLPRGIWWLRIILLGALNISIFLWLLFETAYRLPGGVAATIGAVQPLFVIFLARIALGSAIRALTILAVLAGICGVALLVLTPQNSLDPVGVITGLAGALSLASGTVLTRLWQPPASQLTFTAWQLMAGGLLLLPAAIWFEPALPKLTIANIGGLAYLSVIGAAFTYFLWFRGISRLEPVVVSTLGFLSPGVAVILGWVFLGQSLNPLQFLGFFVILGCVMLSQYSERPNITVSPRTRPG